MPVGVEDTSFSSQFQSISRVRVLLAIRDKISRAGIWALLEAESDIEIVGSATELSAELFRSDAADVVLLEAEADQLRHALGEVAGEVARHCIRVVLYTREYLRPEQLAELAMASVNCAVTRDDPMEDIVSALRYAYRGSGWVSPTIGAALLRSHTSPAAEPTGMQGVVKGAVLTNREQDLLPLVADGLTDQEIGRHLYLSVRAVKYHVSNLLAKFNARNRTHLVNLAFRAELLPMPVRLTRRVMHQRHGTSCGPLAHALPVAEGSAARAESR